VFGLHLEANRQLPGLIAAATHVAPDLRLWLGAVPSRFAEQDQVRSPLGSNLSRDPSSTSRVTVWTDKDFIRIVFEDGTEFFVNRSGTEIWATWPDSLTLEDTATYLLGPIFSIVLRLRGTISLHASAVRIGDVAVAFIGPQGAGKSTTAAFFATAGHSVLTMISPRSSTVAPSSRSSRLIPG